MYDSDCMCVYHVSLNESSLVEEFKRRWSAEPSLPFEILKLDSLTNQMAVLQHQLQTTSDPNRSRNVSINDKNDYKCERMLLRYSREHLTTSYLLFAYE